MQFDDHGVLKTYVQIGTVMTDPDYRGQGLNKYIFEQIFKEYEGKVDGFYLFGNDSVTEYYPKFGFKPAMEYEYRLRLNENASVSYQIEKIDLSKADQKEKLINQIKACEKTNLGHNPNDAFAMHNNIGLYYFWLADEFGENVYYIKECDAYVLAYVSEQELTIQQIISSGKIDIERLAHSFGTKITSLKFSYTPMYSNNYEVRQYHKEDCNLFVLGDWKTTLEHRIMFPVISHA